MLGVARLAQAGPSLHYPECPEPGQGVPGALLPRSYRDGTGPADGNPFDLGVHGGALTASKAPARVTRAGPAAP